MKTPLKEQQGLFLSVHRKKQEDCCLPAVLNTVRFPWQMRASEHRNTYIP